MHMKAESSPRLRLEAAARVDGDVGSASFDVVCATNEINSYGYRVDPNGFDLERFKRNPVVLYAHNAHRGFLDAHDPVDTLPIGRAENVRIEDGVLKAKLVFGSKDYSELADKVRLGFLEGMLHAVSVGFDPLDVVIEMVDGVEIPVIKRAELWELSVVPLPADPGAVREQGARARDHLCRLAAGFGGTMSNREIQLSATERELVTLTGESTPDAALGVVRGWKESAAASEKLTARITELEAQGRERDLEALITEAKASKKLTPALEAEVRELAKLSMDRVRGLIKSLPHITALAASPAEQIAPSELSKRWEDHTPAELAAMHTSNPELYAVLKRDRDERRQSRG